MDPPVQESFEVPGREEIFRRQLGISVIIGIVQVIKLLYVGMRRGFKLMRAFDWRKSLDERLAIAVS